MRSGKRSKLHMHSTNIPALEAPDTWPACRVSSSAQLDSKRTVLKARSLTKLTPFSLLISAFFCPLLASPLCSKAVFKSATRSEWSGLPSNVTSSLSAILLHPSARTSGAVHEHTARHRSLISGRESRANIKTRAYTQRTGINDAFSCSLQYASRILQYNNSLTL